MSSSKPKKVVHYERGTKAPSHRHHNSHDSGVGSSSASDRATVHDDEEIHRQQDVDDQRYNLRVVQEALSAAQERIKQLEASHKNLNNDLSESNKENRVLRREKSGLLKENVDLLELIEDLNQRIKRREGSPRSVAAAATVAGKPERRPSVSVRQGPPSPRGQAPVYLDERERPLSNHGERRASMRQNPGPPSPRQQVFVESHSDRRPSSALYDRTAPLPSAPQPPPNHHPNPFTPRNISSPIVTYAAVPSTIAYTPSTVSYTPSTVSYSPSSSSYSSHQPMYIAPSQSSSSKDKRKDKRGEFDDGKYHLKPL